MRKERNYKKSFREKIKTWIFLLLIIFILIYFVFKSFDYFKGPVITIYSPRPYETLKGNTFLLQGNAKNAKKIFINGREITINENGDFKELLVNKAPYTLLVVNSEDKYGKKKEIVLFFGKEEEKEKEINTDLEKDIELWLEE